MPAGGLGTLALLGAAQAVPKLYQSFKQSREADALKLQDTTTPEQREMLAIARQRAAARLPGMAMQQGRLAQTQSAALQAASLGAGGASDFLASASAADRVRQNGEAQLGFQGEQFNQQAQNQLGQQLQMQAQQRQRDLAASNSQKAALRQGSAENLNNAVNGAAAYAAYGINQGGPPAGEAGVAAGAVEALSPRAIGLTQAEQAFAPGIRGTGLPGYAPSITGGRYRTSNMRFGYNYSPL